METKNYPVIVSPQDHDNLPENGDNRENKQNMNASADQIKRMKEYLPTINKFMLDIGAVRKRITGILTQEDVKKLDVLMDCIKLYENPDEIELIKEYYDGKEREIKIQEERKRRMNEYEKKHWHQNNTTSAIFYGSEFPDFSDIKSFQESEEEEILENSSEDEFMHDQYIEMLDKSFDNLEVGNSMLKQNMTIQRFYTGETSISDDYVPWDHVTDDEKTNVKIHTSNGNDADNESSDTEIDDALADIEIVVDPTDDEDNEPKLVEIDVSKNLKEDWIHKMALSVIKNNIDSIM